MRDAAKGEDHAEIPDDAFLMMLEAMGVLKPREE
jgi:hypothetical protein